MAGKTRWMYALPGMALGLFLAIATANSARADVVWLVNGTFNDGGTVSGYFDINQYGYLDGYNLQTSSGSVLPGFDYTPNDSYFSNGTFYFDAQPGYEGDLRLTFADDLSDPVSTNPIVGGAPGPSWECVGSFSCFDLDGGTTRFISEGFASAAPEPGMWALMLLGIGMIGGLMRSSRARAARIPVAV
jgi:PEP-CTERM motif